MSVPTQGDLWPPEVGEYARVRRSGILGEANEARVVPRRTERRRGCRSLRLVLIASQTDFCYSIHVMYAIIETGGRQFWVTPGETIKVEKLEAEQGKTLTFTALWAVGDAKDGGEAASSKDAKVTAEVVGQGKGPKIIVFKRKRRKGYRKKQGHRQGFTEIRVDEIALA